MTAKDKAHEFTPTTEQVRDLFEIGASSPALPEVDVPAAMAMFDLWLAAHVAEPTAKAEPLTIEFETREQELYQHQPLLSMKDGGIVGCTCPDRVFNNNNNVEDSGTHLAEVFDALFVQEATTRVEKPAHFERRPRA